MVWSIFSFAKAYPEVAVNREEGFVDISIPIASCETLKDGSTRIVVRGDLDGRRVGFAMVLNPEWKATEIENTGQFFYWGSGSIVRTGKLTDEFLVQLAHLYGEQNKPTGANDVVRVEVVGLANDPSRLLTSPTNMKVFLNSNGGEDLYGEIFINTDVPHGVLEFNEKDPEYRSPLLKSLAR
jgi:hypothetical protein